MRLYKLLPFLLCLILVAGCSKQEETDAEKEPTIEDKSPFLDSDKQAIAAVMEEYIDRVKEGDLTVLYENEFSYYKDEHSMSEYMEMKRVLDYKFDTLSAIEIDSIHVMDDSAVLVIRILYESAAGGTLERPYMIKMYRSFGGWIRPYLSKWEEEAEYLEQIREYEEAVSGGDSN